MAKRRASRSGTSKKKGKPRKKRLPSREEIKAFVGKRLFNSYLARFGYARTLSVGEVLKKNVKEKTIGRLEETQRKKGRLLDFRPTRPRRSVSFHPGRRRGTAREFVNGKFTGRIVKIKTAMRIKKLEARTSRVDAIAFGLGISQKEARDLIRSVEKKAAQDLRKFKRSSNFKRLGKRTRRRLNLRREKAKYLDLLMDMIEAESP